MSRAWKALILGGTFVGMATLVGHHGTITPVPFWLLLPGIMAGAIAPDSGFNPEGDTHPWGPISSLIAYAVNAAIYSGLVYLMLSLIRRPRRAAK